MASAPVRVFTFTTGRQDRGPVVGVNKCSRKCVGVGVGGLSGKQATHPGWRKVGLFGQGRVGATEVLSKQVSVVSFRRRVSSSTSSFPHLEHKHIKLCLCISFSVHHSVSQDLQSEVSCTLTFTRNYILQISLVVL